MADPAPETLRGLPSPDDKAAIARALAALERKPEAAETLALLDAAYGAPRAHVVGVTGRRFHLAWR